MNAKENLSKLRPLIIIILLFLAVFFLRADAVYMGGVPSDYKSHFEDQNGFPYFSEMDSYYNLRMTQDYLDHGHLGDTIQNGTQWDLHSYYPSGRDAEYPPLIVIITAFIYKLINSFTDVPLNAVAIWTAPFIASLAVIPAYLFARRLTNDYGGIAAGLLVGTAPIYFSHTFAGFFDTDMFNVLFPILVVGFFIESIRADNIQNRSIFVVLAAVSMLLYSMAWEVWWYIFYLVIGTVVVYLLVSNYLFKIETIKPFKDYPSKIKWFLDQPALFSLIVFAVTSSILISIYMGFSGFLNALTGFLGAVQLQSAVQGTAYPNVFISVQELEIPSIWKVIIGVGGILPVVFGILVVPLLLWKLKPDTDKDSKKKNTPKGKSKPRRGKRPKTEVEEKIENNNVVDLQVMETNKNYLLYATLFTIWLLMLGYTLTKGSRFLEQFSVPIALGAGIFIGMIVPYFRKHIKSTKYCTLAVLLLIAFTAYSSVSTAYTTSNSVVPGTDDSMYNSLTWIKNNTPQNTIITSWWDYGHLFAVAADRPVTFDGGSQNTPRAYWVGKALLTSNEDLSAGILRMLTSGGNHGYQTVETYIKDTGKSVEILNHILPVDKQAAQTILINNYKLNQDQAQNVLKYTHPDNPNPHVLLLNGEYLLSRSSWWSYFGSWNFKNNTGTHYGYDTAAAASKQVNGTTVIQAENGVVAQVNGTQIIAGLQYSQGKSTQIIAPHKLIMIQEGKIIKNQLVSNDSLISIVLIKKNNSYTSIVMNKELEDSMFTRLYLMNGIGLNKFKLAHQDSDVTVWNLN